VPIETLRKECGHVNKPFNIATSVSFEYEHKRDAVDIMSNSNGTANAVEAKVINGHVEQETVD
jgi:hypothetical protein